MIFLFASKIYFYFFFECLVIVAYLCPLVDIFLISFLFFRTTPCCLTLYFKVQTQTRANLPYLSMLFTDYQVT